MGDIKIRKYICISSILFHFDPQQSIYLKYESWKDVKNYYNLIQS